MAVTIDILYVVGSGSRHGDAELRWSLRSLEKHAKNLYGVVNVVPKVVGRAPDWFAGEVLPVGDLAGHKQLNMAHKVVEACRAGFVKGEFMMSADDHFLTKDVDFVRAPQYWTGLLLKPFDGKGEEKYFPYWKGIGLARDVLLASGLPAMNFTQHFNTYFHSDDAETVVSLMERASLLPNGEAGANMHSLFANCWLVRNHALSARPVLVRHDVKYPGSMRDTLMNGGADTILGFSISDDAFSEPGFVDWMNERYKEASRWERAQ